MSPSRHAGVIPAVLATVFIFAALIGVFATSSSPLELLREGGAWSLVVVACVLVGGVGAPSLAGLTNAPRAVWAGSGALAVFVGALGVVVSAGAVHDAIGQVNPADRVIMAAAGTGEVASILMLAGIVGGAVIVGTGFVIAVVDKGVGGAALVAVGGASMAVGVYWSSLRDGLRALTMVSAADRMTILVGVAEEASVSLIVGDGVAVVATLGAAVLGLTRPPPLSVGKNVSVVGVAVAIAAALTVAVVSLNGMTADAAVDDKASSAYALYVFRDGETVAPPGKVIRDSGVVDGGGDNRTFGLEKGVHGAAVRKAIAAVEVDGYGGRVVELSGPAAMAPPSSLPSTFAPLFRQPLGVSLGVYDGETVAGLRVIGVADDALGDRLRQMPRITNDDDAPREGDIAVVWGDDVDGAVLADTLAKLGRGGRGARLLAVVR